MVDISLPNLGAYCGQILIVVAVAAIAARFLDVPHATFRLAYWRTVVVLCLALPLVAIAQPALPSLASYTTGSGEFRPTSPGLGVITSLPVPGAAFGIGSYVLTIILAGIGARLMWLAIGFMTLRNLRRTSIRIVLEQDLEALQADIAPRADVRRHERASQPATFGLWQPVILLPDSVRSMPPSERAAIVCHELVHVRRRDWAWMLLEEALRTAFWFHPAMRYAISRVQASREEVVDAEVIARTGDTRAYLHALVTFSAQPAFITAASFVRRSQLSSRLRRMTGEVRMSRLRVRIAVCTLGGILVAALGVAVGGLRYELGAQQFAATVPIDAVQFSVPIARAIVRLDRPVYPSEAWRVGIGAEVWFTARISTDGRVTIEGTPAWQVTAIDSSPVQAVQEFWSREGWREFLDSVGSAVAEWQYVPGDSEVFVQARVTFARPPNRATFRPIGGVQPGPASPLPPIRVGMGGATPPPRRISVARAVYSQAAFAAGVEGIVMLEVLVGTDGAVHGARVLNSIPLLDQSAMDAVAQWRFEPTVVDGVPREVLVTAAVNFSLR